MFFLTLHKNIGCDPSSEPSRRDGSDEGSPHMVSMRNKKKYHHISPLTIGCDPSSEPSRRDGPDVGSQHMVSMRSKK